MPSSWNVYYAVFLSAALGLGIPGVLLLLARLLRSGSRADRGVKAASSPSSFGSNQANNKSILGPRINVRFFLGANASILLVMLALLLIPCTLTLALEDPSLAFRGLVALVSVALIAGLGLLYAFQKGDLHWLKTFRIKESSKMSGK